MKNYRTREGDVTVLDTKTQLTTVGSETAPGALVVPHGMTHITGVIVAQIMNFAAATAYSSLIRLEGAGLKNGPESFAAGAGGVPVATGGNGVNHAVRIPVNLEVVAAQEILIFAEMMSADIGGAGFVVTLEFSDAAGPGEANHKTLTVEGDLATVDALTRLTAQGSIATPSLIVPSTVKKIDKIIYAVSSKGLANGKQVWFLRLGGNAVLGGEQVIALGASGRIAVQAGADAAPQLMVARILEDVDIDVRPSDSISVAVEGAGDDTGTGSVVVTLVFA